MSRSKDVSSLNSTDRAVGHHFRWVKAGALLVILVSVTLLYGSCFNSSSTSSQTPPTLSSIGVTPKNPTIANGSSQQFTATGTYSDQSTQDLTKSVTWSSIPQGAAGVATISNTAGSNGLATSVGTGQTTIQAALGAVIGSTLLTVAPTGVAAIATFHTDNGRTGQNTS